MDELETALAEADIVINALPETEDTYHLLEERHFKQMKDSALFINVGRGTIVDEDVLIEVLKREEIRHATLDVFENEPLDSDKSIL